MPRLTLTDDNIKYIKSNRLKMSGTDMAKHIGVMADVVNRYMRKNGLSVPRDILIKFRTKGLLKPFTKDEDKFIKTNIDCKSIKAMAVIMKRTSAYVSRRAKELGFSELIIQKTLNSRLKKGNIPVNKGKPMPAELYEKVKNTMFKKGSIPPNTKEKDGVIVIRYEHAQRTNRPYKWIRIALGKWYPYHQYLWEQKFGKYNSKSHCLWFKDGNSLNCNLENIELITRKENIIRNRQNFINLPEELKPVIKLNKQLKKMIYDSSREKSPGGA